MISIKEIHTLQICYNYLSMIMKAEILEKEKSFGFQNVI